MDPTTPIWLSDDEDNSMVVPYSPETTRQRELDQRPDPYYETDDFKQNDCEWHVLGDGFTWETQNREQDIATSQRGWAVAQRMLTDPAYQLVVLDELTLVEEARFA